MTTDIQRAYVSFLSGGLCDHQFVGSLLAMYRTDTPLIAGEIHAESSPRIASTRNDITSTFLRTNDAQWLLMLDADITFEPNLLRRLLQSASQADAKIMGGLYFLGGHGQGFRPNLLVNDGEMARSVDNYPEGIVQVNATGAGCLLVHRDVFTTIERKIGDTVFPWFAESQYNGKPYGEDVTFCERAARCGYATYVDTTVKCGHRKTMTVTERTFFMQQQVEAKAAVSNNGDPG